MLRPLLAPPVTPRSPARTRLRARSLVALIAVAAACGDGATSPRGAPSGRLLVTSTNANLIPSSWVSVLQPGGGGRRELTAVDGPAEWDASWSPDGRRIAFARQGGADPGDAYDYSHLFVVNADGSGLRQLTSGCETVTGPRWSTDGSRLVYAGTDCGTDGTLQSLQIRVVGSDGTGAHAITAGRDDGIPDWSPDGTRILFRSRSQLGVTQLYVVHPDGSGLAPLVADATTVCPGPGPVRAARWSPDGARIAYLCAAPEGWQLAIMRAGGTAPVRLTGAGTPLAADNDVGYTLAWSPDGAWLAYTRNVQDNVGWHAYVVSTDPARATQPAAEVPGANAGATDWLRITAWGPAR